MYKAIGYFDEMDTVVIKRMTIEVFAYCRISGFQIIYIKED